MKICVGMEVWLREFLTSALDENECLDAHPGRLSLGKYAMGPTEKGKITCPDRESTYDYLVVQLVV